MGFIQLNVPVFENHTDIDFLRNVFLHEVMHLLAFSRTLYDHFPSQFVRLVEDHFVIQSGSTMSSFRDHLDCGTLGKLPVENQIQNGCHFEKTLFGHELMTPNITARSVLSKFTLLFLEDTGWYRVDASLAEPFYWGLNQTCEFLKSSSTCEAPDLEGIHCQGKACGVESTPVSIDFREIASPPNLSNACSVDFENKSLFIQDEFSGKCFRNEPDSKNSCLHVEHGSNKTFEFETYSPSSKCFESVFLKQKHSLCLRIICSAKERNAYQIGNIGSR